MFEADSAGNRAEQIGNTGQVSLTRSFLSIQGPGCIVNPTTGEDASSRHVLVFLVSKGFVPHPSGTAPPEQARYTGVRGFIPVAALPDPIGAQKSSVRDMSYQEIIDAKRVRGTRCNQTQLNLESSATPRPNEEDQFRDQRNAGNVLVPTFEPSLRYQSQRRTSGQSSYFNYDGFPLPFENFADNDPNPFVPQQAKVMVNSTSVSGGGIVRGIVPVGQPRVLHDYFSYRDPNARCENGERNRVAKWLYLRFPMDEAAQGGWPGLEPFDGWTPYRPPSDEKVPC